MRLSLDQWGLNLARETAKRGTCARRRAGCVLVNSHGHVLATGYNGVAAGVQHCVEYPCQGVFSESGKDLDLCQAIHAEQNALLQCRDVRSIASAYITVSPCITCVKLFLNTSCRKLVFAELYPHPSSEELWRSAGREWVQLEEGSADV